MAGKMLGSDNHAVLGGDRRLRGGMGTELKECERGGKQGFVHNGRICNKRIVFHVSAPWCKRDGKIIIAILYMQKMIRIRP